MTYFSDTAAAAAQPIYNSPECCFSCSRELAGPTVRYDGFLSDGAGLSVFMHRDCAFVMAQRLIVDTWPNRRHGHPMSVQQP